MEQLIYFHEDVFHLYYAIMHGTPRYIGTLIERCAMYMTHKTKMNRKSYACTLYIHTISYINPQTSDEYALEMLSDCLRLGCCDVYVLG